MTITLTGCGTVATLLLCGGIELPTDLTEVPADLQYVIDNREMFEVTDHPLEGVTPGTVIDDLEASIDGCWGYVGTEREMQGDVTLAVVYKIDLDRGLMQMQEFLGLDGSVSMLDNLPAVVVRDREITAVSETEVALEALFSDGALMEEDGTLRGDCVIGMGVTLSLAVPILVTADDDTMLTFEDFTSPLKRYWVRFDCVEDEIELSPHSEPDGS
jgi:hypothetical protein